VYGSGHFPLKPIYSGDFDFDGTMYHGAYEPVVSREVWEQVQAILDGRGAKKTRKVKEQFAFSGLITCGHCGCALVGEQQQVVAPSYSDVGLLQLPITI
jgi:hypothetical protein